MMWDVHAVAGALSGLVLFVAFFAGTITVFHRQLQAWEKPSLRGRGAGRPASIDALVAGFLAEHRPEVPRGKDSRGGPPASRVYVSLPGPGSPGLGVSTVQYAGDD